MTKFVHKMTNLPKYGQMSTNKLFNTGREIPEPRIPSSQHKNLTNVGNKASVRMIQYCLKRESHYRLPRPNSLRGWLPSQTTKKGVWCALKSKDVDLPHFFSRRSVVAVPSRVTSVIPTVATSILSSPASTSTPSVPSS